MKLDRKKLKLLRESKAWSQSHLAEVSGISLRTVQRIEKSGTASPESVRSLCATFCIKISDISINNVYRGDIELTFSDVIRHKISKINNRTTLASFIVAFTIAFITTYSYAGKDTDAPSVIKTFPTSGSTHVDSSLTEVTVTFNEEMQDGSWSWVQTTKDKFPEITGVPKYSENTTKILLPVQLEPNKDYEIWINSQRLGNFKDKSGNSAIPYKLTFKTR